MWSQSILDHKSNNKNKSSSQILLIHQLFYIFKHELRDVKCEETYITANLGGYGTR